jgi:hypothetical protein
VSFHRKGKWSAGWAEPRGRKKKGGGLDWCWPDRAGKGEGKGDRVGLLGWVSWLGFRVSFFFFTFFSCFPFLFSFKSFELKNLFCLNCHKGERSFKNSFSNNTLIVTQNKTTFYSKTFCCTT